MIFNHDQLLLLFSLQTLGNHYREQMKITALNGNEVLHVLGLGHRLEQAMTRQAVLHVHSYRR